MVGAESEVLVWSVQPWRKSPSRVLIILGFAVLGFVGGALALKNLLLGVAGFAIIVGSTAEYWLGTHFRVDPKGVSSRTGPSLTSMEWAEIKRVIVSEEFVKVSPLEVDSRLSAFRGVRLSVTPEQRNEVLAAVQRNVNQDVRFLEV